DDVLTREALFFSQLAVVTFGGAYAVLAYLNQAAVSRFGWLAQGEMVTGLGLAETTPGPLIIVTEFVGFLAAYRDPGGLPPVLAGVLGAAVSTWATFAPSFVWIFLGAPSVERLRGSGRLAPALGAITASVVGVIATLAVTFGVHVLFARVAERRVLGAVVPVPDPGSLDALALLVAGAVFLGVWRRGWSVPAVVAGSAAVGLLRALLG
ncbi:MAG TPA: chromate transporter, partial [Actinomycetota bacterium]|nr:chromate transporter [Actinomycetota bacterium]